MTAEMPTSMEKCRGAMLGAAIGDALGWPNETRSGNRIKKPKVADNFVEWTRSCGNPRWHDEKILPGEYSDDTQMTLSVARSILAGNWENFFARVEIPFWLVYERGGGGALKKAAKSLSEKKVSLWQSGHARDYFNAGGNGAAMRILPHVIAAAKTSDTHALMVDVAKNALITHGHPRAVLGAGCYAYALDYLLRKETVLEYGELVAAVINGREIWGKAITRALFGNWLDAANRHSDFEYASEWKQVRGNMIERLEFIQASLKKGLMLDNGEILAHLGCFSEDNGAGDIAVLAAVYLASRYANNPVLGIKIPAFSFRADTDTIASMTGGLLGILCGTAWIPPDWKTVQDHNCLVRMAELLLSDNRKEMKTGEASGMASKENRWRHSPIGEMRLLETKAVSNGKNGMVVIEKWQTALGQTIYKKEFRPCESGKKENSRHPRQASLFDMTATARPGRFVLNETAIAELFENPHFNQSVTVGKAMRIIQMLLKNNSGAAAISREFDIEETMVDLIKSCMTE